MSSQPKTKKKPYPFALFCFGAFRIWMLVRNQMISIFQYQLLYSLVGLLLWLSKLNQQTQFTWILPVTLMQFMWYDYATYNVLHFCGFPKLKRKLHLKSKQSKIIRIKKWNFNDSFVPVSVCVREKKATKRVFGIFEILSDINATLQNILVINFLKIFPKSFVTDIWLVLMLATK